MIISPFNLPTPHLPHFYKIHFMSVKYPVYLHSELSVQSPILYGMECEHLVASFEKFVGI